MGLSYVAAQSNYAAAAIPEALVKNAFAVVRKHELKFTVLNKGEAIETEHKVVTLLNRDAIDWFGEPAFYYYQFLEIKDIEASVYNAEGKLVRNLKKKDIEDVKPLDYFVDDIRYKLLRLPSNNFPYTIEYTVTKKHKGLMFYPRFQPQSSPNIAVEYASFEVVMPTDLEVRIKEVNLPPNCNTGPNKWELQNIATFLPEPFSRNTSLKLPAILSAPTEFSFGGFDGNMRTWESYGEYLFKLNKTQTELSPELKQRLLKMVEPCNDVYCKIQRIYEYLQSNTRYYYVGLGIGGWQPTAAAKVDQYKYGDCKGLSNYTASMLNAVGIPACYAIIRAGKNEQFTQYPDFPNAWFNHAIVCVPLENDTIWLECTSQTESCGFLGDFTDNRTALVMTPTGGKIIQTPKYDETKNTVYRATNVNLQPDGSAKVLSQAVFGGISQNYPAHLESLHDEKRKESLYKTLDINNFEIVSLDFKRNSGRIPNVEQTMSLSLQNFASANGKRLFLPINLMAAKMEVPSNNPARQSEFQPHPRGYAEIDSLTISLPPGFSLEGKFEPIKVESTFGSFENEVVSDGQNLLVLRRLVVNANIHSHEAFPAFLDFLKMVSKADKAKLVLVKNEGKP